MARTAPGLLGHQEPFPLRLRLPVVQVVDLGRVMLPASRLLRMRVATAGAAARRHHTLRPDHRLLLVVVAAGSSSRAIVSQAPRGRLLLLLLHFQHLLKKKTKWNWREMEAEGCKYTC